MVESVQRAGTGLSAIVLQPGTQGTRALEVSTNYCLLLLLYDYTNNHTTINLNININLDS